MEIAMIVLAVVLVLITCQQWLPIHIPIWVIMLGGAVVMLCFRQISWFDAWQSIDWNIIGFLFGVFVLAEYLEQVHVTHRFADTLLRQSHSVPVLLLMLIVVAANLLDSRATHINSTLTATGNGTSLVVAAHLTSTQNSAKTRHQCR